MKKFILSVLLIAVAAASLCGCSKDASVSGTKYTVDIARSSHSSVISTTHTVYEYDAAGALVATRVIPDTEVGVVRDFSAREGASYLKIRMDLRNKPDNGLSRTVYYSYMFVLGEGGNVISLDGSSPVQDTAPSMRP